MLVVSLEEILGTVAHIFIILTLCLDIQQNIRRLFDILTGSDGDEIDRFVRIDGFETFYQFFVHLEVMLEFGHAFIFMVEVVHINASEHIEGGHLHSFLGHVQVTLDFVVNVNLLSYRLLR